MKSHAIELSSIERIIIELNQAQVRYLVAGGVAVIAHGVMRLTFDLDLVLALDRENVLAAIRVLERLRYRPNVPVKADELADEEKRRQWIHEKQMMVFQMVCDQSGFPPIDIFVEEPFNIDVELECCLNVTISEGVSVRIVGLPRLLKMKELANREKDRDDIRRLKALHNEVDDENN